MVKKLSIIVIALMCILSICPSASYAVDTSTIMDGANKFLDQSEEREVFNKTNEKEAVDTIYFIMLTIGIVLAVLVGSVLAIQFITSGAVGQAKVKEKIIPFVLGAFVVFGAFGIWRITYSVLKDLF